MYDHEDIQDILVNNYGCSIACIVLEQMDFGTFGKNLQPKVDDKDIECCFVGK